MTLLLTVCSLAALFGLWAAVCRVHFRSSLPHLIAVLLMMFGDLTLLSASLGARFITTQWLMNGLAAMLFGLAMWLAFDRRNHRADG